MRTSQLLHVMRCGVNGRKEAEEEEEEEEDTAGLAHLCKDSHSWLQIDLKLQLKRHERVSWWSHPQHQSDLRVILALLLPWRRVTRPVGCTDPDLQAMLSVPRKLLMRPRNSLNPPRAWNQNQIYKIETQRGLTERNRISKITPTPTTTSAEAQSCWHAASVFKALCAAAWKHQRENRFVDG